MVNAVKVNWYDDEIDLSYLHHPDNQGYIYGIYYYQDEDVIEVEWFKTEEERDIEVRRCNRKSQSI